MKNLKNENICLTLGNFDGVHLGHKHLLKKIRDKKNNLKTLVLSFIPHPLKVIKNSKKFLINTYYERRGLLEKEGIDFLFEIPFTERLSQLSPRDFSQQFLFKLSRPKKIFIGHDSTFGPNKKGNIHFLKSFFKDTNIDIEQLEELTLDQESISSTQIREHLKNGDIQSVNKKLGRKYFVKGYVIHELGRGKKIGIPTVNIRYDKHLLLPQNGVYSSQILWKGNFYPSVTNIGTNPTFREKKEINVETHILDFNVNIYGEEISVFFLSRLRQEKKFSTSVDLVRQIQKDIEKRKKL